MALSIKSILHGWIDLIKQKHGTLRWNKLERLAPVRSMEFASLADQHLEYISVTYQKIYDKDGNLTKLMVLLLDETEKREKERIIKEERSRHENEMKTILAIANTPEEDVVMFVEDSELRLRRIHDEVEKHLNGVKIQLELYDFRSRRGNGYCQSKSGSITWDY